ncbi:MAG: Mov34/MPN/PAD-1 family protein [Acidilobus sp.]
MCLGIGNRVIALMPAENLLRSPVEFLANPLDIVTAYKAAENLHIDVVALYHTHPDGDAAPSQMDLEGMRLWPLPWIIASRSGVRAWVLSSGLSEEVTLEAV